MPYTITTKYASSHSTSITTAATATKRDAERAAAAIKRTMAKRGADMSRVTVEITGTAGAARRK